MLKGSSSTFGFYNNVTKNGIVKTASLKKLNSIVDAKKTFNKFASVERKYFINAHITRLDNDESPEIVLQDFFASLKAKRKACKKLDIRTAKLLRQYGIFKTAGKGVYEDLDTSDFWKISQDKKNLVRCFTEDENGIADKRASSKKLKKKAFLNEGKKFKNQKDFNDICEKVKQKFEKNSKIVKIGYDRSSFQDNNENQNYTAKFDISLDFGNTEQYIDNSRYTSKDASIYISKKAQDDLQKIVKDAFELTDTKIDGWNNVGTLYSITVYFLKSQK